VEDQHHVDVPQIVPSRTTHTESDWDAMREKRTDPNTRKRTFKVADMREYRQAAARTMNLMNEISPELWEAVSNVYEHGNYSHAILEAIHFLSASLRDKAGVDGDGSSLIGQALGGDNPKLRINGLKTDTERNVQKGVEQILRGVYLGIRNPRSHEQTTDKKATADAIIVFVNYILQLLNASQQTFTIEKFVKRVVDPEFVDSARYAELLIAEVPNLKRGDVLIEIFNKRLEFDLRKIRYVVRALLDSLVENQLSNYLNIVSDELRIATDEEPIRLRSRC
jgi:uncharacterized protein (TIGR02391 family)